MRLIRAAPLLLLASCAAAGTGTTPAGPQVSGATDAGIEGLTLRYFRCDNGEAFTVQNYQNGTARVTTRSNRYDLRGSGNTYAGGGVTYTREGSRATLTGADGQYANCTAA